MNKSDMYSSFIPVFSILTLILGAFYIRTLDITTPGQAVTENIPTPSTTANESETNTPTLLPSETPIILPHFSVGSPDNEGDERDRSRIDNDDD